MMHYLFVLILTGAYSKSALLSSVKVGLHYADGSRWASLRVQFQVELAPSQTPCCYDNGATLWPITQRVQLCVALVTCDPA
jgi:hypothetical protein